MWMGGELGIAEGGEPPPAENRPLPQLRHGVPPAKSVVLSAPYTVSYERMLASLGDALLDKPLASMSGRLVVRELDLYSSGPDVVLGLGLEGQRTGSPLPTRGNVYLTGTPEYNPEAGTLSIRRLRVTPASRNPLAHGSRWVLEEAQVWAAEIEQRMNWDTAGVLEQHEQQLGRYFNRTINGRFDLWGSISEISVSGVLPQASGVALQTQARGDLELLFVP
jgi:hypothetical protein